MIESPRSPPTIRMLMARANLFELGAEHAAEPADKRRIALINVVSVLGILASSTNLPFVRGEDRMGFAVTVVAIVWLSGVLYLHRVGRLWLAAFAFSLTAPLALGVQIFKTGPVLDNQLYLLVSALIPFLVFSSRHTTSALVTAASSILVFVALDTVWVPLDVRLEQLAARQSIFIVNNIVAAGMIGVVGYFFRAIVQASETAIDAERVRSDRVLESALPQAIAARLKRGETSIAERVGDVSVLFCRVANFAALVEQLGPLAAVRLLDTVFSAFDELCPRHGVSKIKATSDGYVAACGVPEHHVDHAERLTALALAIQLRIGELCGELPAPVELRVGINSGPVVAGVIGKKRPTYDLWGDVVNTAQRMERHGASGEVHVSAVTYSKINHRFRCEAREPLEVKGKLPMRTYFVKGLLEEGEAR